MAKGTRTITWLVGIAAFVAMYYVSENERWALFGWTIGLLVVVLVVWFVFYVAHMNKESRQFVDANREATEASARGDLTRAVDLYRSWCSAKAPDVQTAAQHGVASALTRQGEHKQAVDFLEQQLARDKYLPASPLMASDLALAHALLGELDKAKTWLDKADTTGTSALARAVVECRTDKAADAARSLDDNWADYESVLTGSALRPLRVVRAFAQAQTDVRNAGMASAPLATIRPSYPGEYDFLGVAWPEMATFLAAHELTSRAA
jgi:tetratricopeptide (TPR) repeat protein